MTITVLNAISYKIIATVQHDDYTVAAHEAKQAAVAAVVAEDIIAEAYSPTCRRMFRVSRSNDFADNGRVYISN